MIRIPQFYTASFICPDCREKFGFVAYEFTHRVSWAFTEWRLTNEYHALNHTIEKLGAVLPTWLKGGLNEG